MRTDPRQHISSQRFFLPPPLTKPRCTITYLPTIALITRRPPLDSL